MKQRQSLVNNNKKKRRILIGILTPLTVIGVGLGMALPIISCSCNNNDAPPFDGKYYIDGSN
jgi:hypothetical protein